jgi:hypothetical protein
MVAAFYKNDMKNIIIIICFFCTSLSFSQGGAKVDAIKFQGKVTTIIRDAFDVPIGEVWLIWNNTTSQLEIAEDNDVWKTVGNLQKDLGNDIGSYFDINTELNNSIEIGDETQGLYGSKPYVRLYGGGQPDAAGIAISENRISAIGYSNTDIDAIGANSLITKSYFDANNSGSSTDDQVASEVPITDSGDYFIGIDVEDALQEVGLDLDNKLRNGTNTVSSLTTISNTNGDGIFISETIDYALLRGGGLSPPGVRVDSSKVIINNYTNSEIDTAGDRSIVTKEYTDAKYATIESITPEYSTSVLSDVTLTPAHKDSVMSFSNAGKVIVRVDASTYNRGDYFDLQVIDQGGYFRFLEPDGRFSTAKYGKTNAGSRARIFMEYNGTDWQYFNGVVVEYAQNEYLDATAANPVTEINGVGAISEDSEMTTTSISSDVNDGTYALQTERTSLSNATEYTYIPLGITDGEGDDFVVEVDYKVVSGSGWQLQLSTSYGWVTSDIDSVSSATWATNIFLVNEMSGGFAFLRINKTDADLGTILIDNIRVIRQ